MSRPQLLVLCSRTSKYAYRRGLNITGFGIDFCLMCGLDIPELDIFSAMMMGYLLCRFRMRLV